MYLSSSAALTTDSRSNVSFVSFCTSGMSVSSRSSRSSWRKGFSSMRLGLSRSVKKWKCCPFVRMAIRALVVAK
ncbi:Uncharacterised protein [Mycobacteroides abscessus]|nr:Uncharacterised protein [Mycobacteroides abscessus]